MPGQVQFGVVPAAAGLSIQELALAPRRLTVVKPACAAGR